MSLIALITVVLFGGLCGILLLIAGTRGVAEPSFDVHKDIEAFGLVASLWIHRQSEARFKPVQAVPGIPGVSMPQEEREESTHLGHIVVVQSESFFDARRLLPTIRPELLQAYDRVRAQALCAGRLQVPAWGANTMRTEFAFLTGIEDSQLGVHGFNPYRKLARQSMDSIASRLSEIGYDSLCLHPHPATFFGRDQVFPALGFKRFLDIKDFPDAEPFGPCIGDAAVTEKIIDILAGATQPTLLFAITMENHGPLHLEKVSQDELSGLYTHPPEAGFEDLSVYLRHLRNVDAMIDRLTLHLRRYHPSSTLVFYGDHVPSMPKVYDRLRFTDGRSDYFVWSAGQASREMTEQDLKVEQLATQTLLACGLVDS